jgi:hypothetical protein
MTARIVAALMLIAALAACSAQSTGDTTSVATPMPAATTAVTEAAGKVSANDASQAELIAALTAAGVLNAERWTQEVLEYRPYPFDDATLQKLQDNLAKYNPDPSTLQAILGALEP